MQDMRRNFLPKFIEICMPGDAMCPSIIIIIIVIVIVIVIDEEKFLNEMFFFYASALFDISFSYRRFLYVHMLKYIYKSFYK